jgi:hypothetical protein
MRRGFSGGQGASRRGPGQSRSTSRWYWRWTAPGASTSTSSGCRCKGSPRPSAARRSTAPSPAARGAHRRRERPVVPGGQPESVRSLDPDRRQRRCGPLRRSARSHAARRDRWRNRDRGCHGVFRRIAAHQPIRGRAQGDRHLLRRPQQPGPAALDGARPDHCRGDDHQRTGRSSTSGRRSTSISSARWSAARITSSSWPTTTRPMGRPSTASCCRRSPDRAWLERRSGPNSLGRSMPPGV